MGHSAPALAGTRSTGQMRATPFARSSASGTWARSRCSKQGRYSPLIVTPRASPGAQTRWPTPACLQRPRPSRASRRRSDLPAAFRSDLACSMSCTRCGRPRSLSGCLYPNTSLPTSPNPSCAVSISPRPICDQPHRLANSNVREWIEIVRHIDRHVWIPWHLVA